VCLRKPAATGTTDATTDADRTTASATTAASKPTLPLAHWYESPRAVFAKLEARVNANGENGGEKQHWFPYRAKVFLAEDRSLSLPSSFLGILCSII
jgi:hypothetical protein